MRTILHKDVFFFWTSTQARIIVPTILRAGKYRFFFFSNERREPRHIHVESGDNYAKFWLEPLDLAKSVGYKEIELTEIRRLIQDNVILLKASWDAYFGS